MDITLLTAELVRDELEELLAYYDCGHPVTRCPKCGDGVLTIGVGHNLEHQIPRTASRLILAVDIDKAIADLDEHLPWWRELDEVRGRVLANMTFNMGIGGLLEFHQMLAALRADDYGKAATEMIASRWATQVKDRAFRLEHAMRTGIAQ